MQIISRQDSNVLVSTSASEAEDLLADPKIWRRLLIGLLVSLAALPFLPGAYVAGWLGAWLLATGAEQSIAGGRGYVAADLAGGLVSFALAALQAIAAQALIDRGDGAARFFAVALIGFSVVNILFRYYAAPRLMLAIMLPHAAVLAGVCWGILADALREGHHLRALTPIATLCLYIALVWPTKGRLVDAWLKLVRARAEAQAGRQAAEAASRAKSDFLATMSHEIRTPLNGILGMAQALQSERPTAKQATGLRVIRSCGETLLAIVDDVLDLAKVEAGRLTLERHSFDMEHVTRGAVATFGPLAAGKQVNFAFSIDQAAKGTFVGDKVRLRQILYNLVSNAVKFTERGAVGVSVGYADGCVTLEVADSGLGIAREDLERIFEKFVQADSSRTRSAGGAGLGLAICRQLVELMGGSIRVSSELGRGSIFSVSLPLVRTDEARPPSATATCPANVGSGQAIATLRILAAEDNEVNRLVLATLLSQAGLSLTIVSNGLEAVKAWRSADWDVILMDVQMPVMDGVEATREIRAAEQAEGRPRTPILALTANAMPEQCAEYAAAGMDQVVTKPIDIGRLFRAIESAVQAAASVNAA
jgi:signal transduction histidine kinase/CheY-like chemotaxis protein